MLRLNDVLTADVREIVDLRVDYIVQNTSNATLQCHFTDGWGAYKPTDDPTGRRGLQDCLLSRYNLCAQHGHNNSQSSSSWFDFTVCTFRNQQATSLTTDGMAAFNLTIRYCAALTGFSYPTLQRCAEGEAGLGLLEQSHVVDETTNAHIDPKGHHHPDWLVINGHDYAPPYGHLPPKAPPDWLSLICAAYSGSPKPASCGKSPTNPCVGHRCDTGACPCGCECGDSQDPGLCYVPSATSQVKSYQGSVGVGDPECGVHGESATA